MSTDAGTRGIAPQLARIVAEPYYQPIGDEAALFESAHRRRLPVLLKVPTGCGKTRFVEYMAWRLQRPLVTVACHDDLTTADLVGRYLIIGNETVWVDGPLTAAVRAGALCYLDEIVEARKDTTVVIHPLTDTRRVLPVEKRGELVHAPDDFLLVVSYNPGYQSVLKELIKKLSLDGWVELLGAKTQAEGAQLLQTADCYVQSSVSEGIPVSIMEAMATGLPVCLQKSLAFLSWYSKVKLGFFFSQPILRHSPTQFMRFGLTQKRRSTWDGDVEDGLSRNSTWVKMLKNLSDCSMNCT